VHAATAPKERHAKRQLPTRDEQIKSLQTESFDVLIIGGGASGSGCALDSVTRGKINCSAEVSAFIPLFPFHLCFHLACIILMG
jgi:glycerol-3-phosphate dehydrogenase